MRQVRRSILREYHQIIEIDSNEAFALSIKLWKYCADCTRPMGTTQYSYDPYSHVNAVLCLLSFARGHCQKPFSISTMEMNADCIALVPGRLWALRVSDAKDYRLCSARPT